MSKKRRRAEQALERIKKRPKRGGSQKPKKKAAVAPKKKAARAPQVCPECFVLLPSSGQCDECF